MQHNGQISIVRDHNVHKPVVVEIGKSYSASHVGRFKSRATRLANLYELSVSFVVEQRIDLPVMGSGRGLLHLRIHMPVGDENIQPPVVVVIEETSAETEYIPRRSGDPRFVAHLVEEPFPIVVPNVIRGTLKVGNIEIELAIIVVIAQRDAHRSHDRSPGSYGHARAETDLFESTVAFVVIEIGVQPIVRYEQIRPAIIVVVGGLHGKILTLWLIDSRLLG